MTRSIEVLASGLGLVESPRYVPGFVLFSDWTGGNIHRIDLGTGVLETVVHVESLPLCFDVRAENLLVLDSRGGRLLTVGSDGETTQSVDVGGLALGGGNEVLSTPDRTYLNFGNFNPAEGFPSTAVGILASVANDGTQTVLADSLGFPNGMALTPDGGTLVLAESHLGRLTAWTIRDDGSLADRRVWADLDGAAPDGISMAADGTCWYADVPAQAVVRVAEGGRILDRIELDRGAFSCLVAPENDTLFVTAAHWPGGARMFDPTHVWDGQLLAVSLG